MYKKTLKQKFLPKILFAGILIFCYLFASLIVKNYYYTNFDEPPTNKYTTDEKIYLKAYYLIEEGKNHYQALNEAVKGEAGNISLHADVFTWRWPTIFYFWSLITNHGNQIAILFWFFALLALIASFFLIYRFTSLLKALIAPLLLAPYFLDTLNYQTAFLLTEWWAWFFIIVAITFFSYNKKKIAWPLFLLSVLTRELIIIPIITLFIFSLVRKKDQIYFLSIILLFIYAFLLHNQAVFTQLGIDKSTFSVATTISKIHFIDKYAFLRTISFSMRKFPLVNLKSHYWLMLAAFISLLSNLINKRRKIEVWYIFIVGWSLTLILPFIISGSHTDYWGILFVPTLLITIPLINLEPK